MDERVLCSMAEYSLANIVGEQRLLRALLRAERAAAAEQARRVRARHLRLNERPQDRAAHRGHADHPRRTQQGRRHQYRPV